MSNLEELEKFILNEIAVDHGKKSIDPDEDLLEQGIIDSMAVMRLVTFLEERFGIEVIDEDMIPDNFQCLNRLVNFVEHKLKKK